MVKRIGLKMLLGLWLGTFSWTSTLLADSITTRAVNVTCTVPALFEITSSQAPPAQETPGTQLALHSNGSAVTVQTNLGKNYSLTKESRLSPNGAVDVVTVTVL